MIANKNDDGSWSDPAIELATAMFTSYFGADAIKLYASFILKDRDMAKMGKNECIKAMVAGETPPVSWETYMAVAEMHVREVRARRGVS
jgi:radical SAM superfamily enzyme